MRGFIVVITALLAMLFLGRKQFIHHWLSLMTIVLGVAFVGYVSILDSQKATTSDMATTSITGVMMIVGAQILVGSQLVTEEKLLSGTSLDPMYIVGMEGFWGLCMFAIMLPIFQ